MEHDNTPHTGAESGAPRPATDAGPHDTTAPPPPSYDPRFGRRLYRTDGPISGVSAGLAEYFNIDVALVRLGLVAGTLLAGPFVPIGYVAAWAIIPKADPKPVAPLMPPVPTASASGGTPGWQVPPAPAPADPVPQSNADRVVPFDSEPFGEIDPLAEFPPPAAAASTDEGQG